MSGPTSSPKVGILSQKLIGWLVVLGFNATLTTKVISWRSVMHMCWLVVLGYNATLTTKVISWRSVTHCVSWLSHTSTNTTFLSKATNYFSHMLLQRWQAKVHRKGSSPQPGIKLTTTRSWVQHAHHWATRVESPKIELGLLWLQVRCSTSRTCTPPRLVSVP